MKSSIAIHRSSSLFKLDPFLDTDGVLRVGGRLKISMLDINEVHLVILPKANLITEAIVTWCHENVSHSGRSMTLSNLDMFGPFVNREPRSDFKRYYTLFTCFASRAAYIEVANAMDTGSFIQALRRFIAR